MARTVDLERARTERLAREIAEELRSHDNTVVHGRENIEDVDRWRRAPRLAGRMLGFSIRTGVSLDRVWAIEGP